MQSKALSVDEYLEELPEDRKEAMAQLRKVINENLPEGFTEGMGYGMIGYVVPHSLYPDGYHCDPKQPLPFMGLASQKNSVNLYHMGIYMDQELYDWFVEEYRKQCKTRLDMGKSCIRMKKMEDIPYGLIGELAARMTVKDWVDLYETALNSSKKKK
ncbi:MAG TPA: DUF1801 domain-containing protein [Flavipsychrobacter sp.]|nr:DUF1801 domain-containing protein [Flavipsychrobacter sp.]